jgi:hypothetical protein
MLKVISWYQSFRRRSLTSKEIALRTRMLYKSWPLIQMKIRMLWSILLMKFAMIKAWYMRETCLINYLKIWLIKIETIWLSQRELVKSFRLKNIKRFILKLKVILWHLTRARDKATYHLESQSKSQMKHLLSNKLCWTSKGFCILKKSS